MGRDRPRADRRRPAVVGSRDGGDRPSAGRAARCHHPARHGGLRGRGGLHAARHHRREPARAAAPCARPHPPDDRRGDRCAASCRGDGTARAARRCCRPRRGESRWRPGQLLAVGRRVTPITDWLIRTGDRDGDIVARRHLSGGETWHHESKPGNGTRRRARRPQRPSARATRQDRAAIERQQPESSAARGGVEPHVRSGRSRRIRSPGSATTAVRCRQQPADVRSAEQSVPLDWDARARVSGAATGCGSTAIRRRGSSPGGWRT